MIAGSWAALDAALNELAGDGFGVLGPENIGRLCCASCSANSFEDETSFVYYHEQSRTEDADDAQCDCRLGWHFESIDDLRHFIGTVRSYGFRVLFELDENLMPDTRTTIEISAAPAFATRDDLSMRT